MFSQMSGASKLANQSGRESYWASNEMGGGICGYDESIVSKDFLCYWIEETGNGYRISNRKDGRE